MELRALSKALVTWAMFFVTCKRRLLHSRSPKAKYITAESKTQVNERQASVPDAHSSAMRQDGLCLTAGFSSHLQSLKTSGSPPGGTGPSPPPSHMSRGKRLQA